MPLDFLHNHPEFADLIRIVAEEKGIDPALIEKDYWIMHCLYGLQQQQFTFALKGGTSLSKGHQIIDRFSEDIDILIVRPIGT
jgi:predicted nucleotidyltransferase component of viral defense system